MVYYCQEFTIEEVIYVINGLKSNQKKFTIARLFTIDQFTIARFDCIYFSVFSFTVNSYIYS